MLNSNYEVNCCYAVHGKRAIAQFYMCCAVKCNLNLINTPSCYILIFHRWLWTIIKQVRKH